MPGSIKRHALRVRHRLVVELFSVTVDGRVYSIND